VAAAEQKLTVLVVDDEQVIRDLCGHALKEYRVLQAGSMREALDLYQSEQIDLVLTDVMMPGGSGLELLRQVKQLDPGALVIVMTGFGDKEVILSALKEDADDFINKPLQILQLRTTVQKALGKKALKDEIATLKRLDSLKGSFLALISHKLKTPITSLSLALEELQRYAAQFSPEAECHERLRSMREDLQFLSRLVASLLRFNQVMLPTTPVALSSCDLAELVRAAAEAVQWSAGRSDVKLSIDLSAASRVACDRERLLFALQQVIDNAFKFAERNGTVTITLLRRPDHAEIVVQDTGCGIPPEEMPKVFERFYQVDPDATGQVPGFGLGLFCAREIIRQYGGSISISSEQGQGTTVTISLKTEEE
jgi:signal transduction histidine kinase